MPLAITRQTLHPYASIPLTQEENQSARSHPQRFPAHDRLAARAKGREAMQPGLVLGRRGSFATPPSGWRVIEADAFQLAKVAGENLTEGRGHRNAVVTGTGVVGVPVAAASVFHGTGVVLGGTPFPNSETAARVRAINALPADTNAVQQIEGAVGAMRDQGLFVQAAVTGGVRGSAESVDLNRSIRESLARLGVPLAFNDSLPERGMEPTDSTVAAVVLPGDVVQFGNHIHVHDM